MENAADWSATPNTDFIYDSDAEAQEASARRYLGHYRASYGFVLEIPGSPQEVFVLPLNPQSLDQDEEAAVTIIPTQGGGKYVENRGSIFKDISISGTTGFLPKANIEEMGGDTYLLGSPPNQTAEIKSQIEAAGARVSGYAAFHKLRSLFRRYWDIKRNESNYAVRAGTCLYFINTKDNETWWVEPMMFRMPRTSKSPLSYPYQIRLRTLAKGMNGSIIPVDPNLIPTTATFYGGESAFIDKLVVTTTSLNDAINKLTSQLNNVTSIVRGFVDSILDIANSVVTGLEDIVAGVKNILNMPRQIVAQVAQLVDSAFDAVSSLANISIDLVDGLNSMKQQFDNIGALPELFVQQWQSRWAATLDRFNDPARGGLTLKSLASNSFSLVSVLPGETVWSMAARLYGDANKGYDIIATNNLSFPYISSSSVSKTPGTVAPGDTVVVPLPGGSLTNALPSGSLDYTSSLPSESGMSVGSSSVDVSKSADTNPWRPHQWIGYTVNILDGTGVGQSRIIVDNDEDTLTVVSAWGINPSADSLFQIRYEGIVPALSGVQSDAYGTDILLAADGDYAISSSGDIQTVSGMDNFRQALDIKLRTERGSLLLHVWFGLIMNIGSKGSTMSLFATRFNAERTILSDSRVAFIKNMVVSLVRDVYNLTAFVVPKGTNLAQPITKEI